MRHRQHDGRPPREQGEPIALGYHTGHWEIGLLVRGAARALRAAGDACRSPSTAATRATAAPQGTTGMFDSLAYRNDAAIVMRRLIRSLPTAGVLGIATCDKGCRRRCWRWRAWTSCPA